MKILVSWLEEYLKEKPDWQLVISRLTQAGLEVENFDNEILEIKVTPNRGDCLSIRGLLHEISMLCGYTNLLTFNQNFSAYNKNNKMIDLYVEKNVLVNIATIEIKNINQHKALPKYITERLEAYGLESKTSIEDLLNYVMLQTNQPISCFDANKINSQSLQFKYLDKDEQIDFLKKSQEISEQMLVIEDADAKLIEIAGLYINPVVLTNKESTQITLVSAYYPPDMLINIAKKYAINSEGFYRFARGIDWDFQENALAYATNLILQYLGGDVVAINSKKSNISQTQITINFNYILDCIGNNISFTKVEKILHDLGCTYTKDDKGNLYINIPSYRSDLNIKEDIVEEIIRVYGYDNIQGHIPQTVAKPSIYKNTYEFCLLLKQKLVARGFHEIINYAFSEESYANLFKSPQIDVNVKLINPIANFEQMRSTLFVGLIKSLEYNINRKVEFVKIFEVAKVFLGETENAQPLKIGGLIYGKYCQLPWKNDYHDVDFFDLKGDIFSILCHLKNIRYMVCNDNDIFHPKKCAKILCQDKEIGVIGALNPKLAAQLGLMTLPYMFELDVNTLLDNWGNFQLKSINKLQDIERDIAFIVKENILAAEITSFILSLGIKEMINVNVFDIYQGANVTKGSKSLALRFRFNADRHLKEEEIKSYVTIIIDNVINKFDAQLRK